MDNDLKEIASKNDSLAMECGKLEQQLAIAIKALEQYAEAPVGPQYRLTGLTACVALKEIEEIK